MQTPEATPEEPKPGSISVGHIAHSTGVAVGAGARSVVIYRGLGLSEAAWDAGLIMAGALLGLGLETVLAYLVVTFTSAGDSLARVIAESLDNQRQGWEAATLVSAAVSVALSLVLYAGIARPRQAPPSSRYRFEARPLAGRHFALIVSLAALIWLPLVTAGRLPPPTGADKTHIVVIVDASARMQAPYADQASKWAVAYGAAQEFLSQQRGVNYSYSLIVVGGQMETRASACDDPAALAVPRSRRNLDAVVSHLAGLAPDHIGSLSAAFALARTTLGALPDDYRKSVLMVIGGPDECRPPAAGDPWLEMIEDLDRIFGPAAVDIQLDAVALVSPEVSQELANRFHARFPGLRPVTSVAEASAAVEQVTSLLSERYRQLAPDDFATEGPIRTAAAATAKVVLRTAVARPPATLTPAPSPASASDSPRPAADTNPPPATEVAEAPPTAALAAAATSAPTPRVATATLAPASATMAPAAPPATDTAPPPTWTPLPTATLMPPAPTAAPSSTPTATLAPPSPTATPIPPSPTATPPPPPTWTPLPTATPTPTLAPEVLIIHGPGNGANLGCQTGIECQISVEMQWVSDSQTFGRTLSVWVLPYPGTPGYKYYVQGDAQYDAGSGRWRSATTIGDVNTPAGAPFRIFAYVTVLGYSGEQDGPPADASLAASVDVTR